MAAHTPLETQTHDKAQDRRSDEIGPVEPMRLVLGEEALPKPIDRMQDRVPRQDIAHPIGHHPWHIENSRTKIQNAGQLRPDFVPRFEEGIEDCINKTDTAPKRPYRDDRG